MPIAQAQTATRGSVGDTATGPLTRRVNRADALSQAGGTRLQVNNTPIVPSTASFNAQRSGFDSQPLPVARQPNMASMNKNTSSSSSKSSSPKVFSSIKPISQGPPQVNVSSKGNQVTKTSSLAKMAAEAVYGPSL